MTWKGVLKTAEKFVTDNSPGILTGLGVAGVVTTALLTGKAAYSSGLRIAEIERKINEKGDFVELDAKEKIHEVWREFIPAASVGASTIAAIVMANQIGSRRAAAVAAAFKISEKLSEEYRQKVVETIGAKSEQDVQNQLVHDRLARIPGGETIVIMGSEVTFFDEFSGRYFAAEMENVKKAVNEINFQVNNNYYASLTDFYDKLDLPKTAVSDEFGWNSNELLEVRFSPILQSNGRPAISIAYNKTPIRHFDRVN